MLYLLEIAYLGKNYAGWQSQPNANTVQAEIENALGVLLKEKIVILGSSRTDTGVHAKQQFATFNGPIHLDLAQTHYSLNRILPLDISISNLSRVKESFHPRFDATSRAYEYTIATKKSPFLINQSYLFTVPLDILAMNNAALLLLNHSDFKCFSKVHTDVLTYNCTIEYAFWEEKDGILIFKIKANRFLRGMVRAIVGSLLQVGLEKWSIADFEQVILSRSRSKAGPAVPAQGLCLVQVNYPKV